MKRDLDLVRKILVAMEEHEHGRAPRELRIDGYSNEQIAFHVHLMGEAGLLKVADVTHMGSVSPEAIPVRILWDGYEFLEAARNQSIWEQAKAKAGEAGLPVMFAVMKELAVGLARGVISS